MSISPSFGHKTVDDDDKRSDKVAEESADSQPRGA
jgi:hypothetical protein